MIHRTINYTDFAGKPHTHEAYFHISKGELSELELIYPGGLKDYLLSIVAKKDQDPQPLVDFLKDFIHRAYGVKSADDQLFVKKPEYWENFRYSNAYSEFFYDLVSDGDRLAAFVNGALPADMNSKPPVSVPNP